MTWLGSSIFGLAGTVLLVCWLLAYVLEPDGGFARFSLVFAVSSYAIDLAWEKVSSRRNAGGSSAGFNKSARGASTAKAA
jgi:hypothetical protein